MSRTLAHYRDLLIVLLGKELKVRYKSTALGYAWSVLHPLVFALVYYLVFGVFMTIGIDHYILFLIAGLFPWQWFSNSLTASNTQFLRNASLIKKVVFPRSLLVVSGVANDLIHFLISIPVIVLLMAIYGRYPTWSWLWAVPLLTAVQFALTCGLALLLATWNVFFRDLERLTGLAMMIWFFLTPVLYDPGRIPQPYHWMLYVNPMAGLAINWRAVFLNQPMNWPLLAVSAGAGLVVAAGGYGLYRRMEWRLAEVV